MCLDYEIMRCLPGTVDTEGREEMIYWFVLYAILFALMRLFWAWEPFESMGHTLENGRLVS
jgi:hypothetical protein